MKHVQTVRKILLIVALIGMLACGSTITPTPVPVSVLPTPMPSTGGGANTASQGFQPPEEMPLNRNNTLVLSSGKPDTLDPAQYLYGAENFIGDIYSGLVVLNTNLDPIPDLAEDWTVSDDQTVYTFTLRQDVYFHTGRPFTAEDVVYSWNRAASPELNSYTVLSYMNDIAGVEEVYHGEADEIGGLRVIDDYTVEVTLKGPRPYFLHKLAYPVSWIVDRETIDQIEEHPIGTGPFFVVEYNEEDRLLLQANPNYHRGTVLLGHILYLIYPGYDVRLYEDGEVDIVYILEDLKDRAEDPGDPLYGNVQEVASMCSSFIRFQTDKPPFDDPQVRRAFALAIDKERYNSVVMEGEGVIADGLYPPGLPGFHDDLIPMPYDPEAAVEALAQSSYGGPDALPEVVMTTSGAGSDISPAEALVIQMWEQVLGVRVKVEQIDMESYYDEFFGGIQGNMTFDGWCADYPDPQNFAEVLFHSASIHNVGRYANSEIDAMLEEARAEPDLETRLRMYQRIEQMLVDDAAAIFISHTEPYYVVTKPYWKGFVSTPIGVPQSMNYYFDRGN